MTARMGRVPPFTDVRAFTAGLLVVAALAVTLATVGRVGDLQNDEPFTALTLTSDATAFREALASDNLPLYYTLLKIWTAIVGTRDWTLRAFSLLAYGLTVIVVGLAGRGLAGPVGGLVAAVLMATSRVGLAHAATARPYALVCLFAATALWLHLRALERGAGPGWRLSVALIAVHAGGLFTHMVYGFFLIASAAASLWLARRPMKVRLAMLPLTGLAIYLAAWGGMLHQTLQLPATAWMPRPGLRDLADGVLLLWGVGGVAMVFTLLTLILLLQRPADAARRVGRAWVFPAVVGCAAVGGAFAASAVKPVYLSLRTPVLMLPGVSLAIGVALARLGHPIVTGVLLVWLVVSAVLAASSAHRLPDQAPTGASLASLARELRCGDRLVAGGLSFAAVSYYARQQGIPACVSIESFPSDMARHPGWFDAGTFTSRAADYYDEARRVGASLGAGTRLWFFGTENDFGAEATHVFEASPTLSRQRTLPLRGAFFQHVSVFVTRPQNAVK